MSMSSHSRFLLEDPLVIVAGAQSRWASRRKIDLAVLLDEQRILSPPNGLSYELVAAVFKAQGLPMPPASMMTNTLDLFLKLLAGGRFLSVVPISALRPASATTPNKAIQLKTAKLNLAPMAEVFASDEDATVGFFVGPELGVDLEVLVRILGDEVAALALVGDECAVLRCAN